MSLIWKYFSLSGRVAFCKNCNFSKNHPPRAPTTFLISHLRSSHPKLSGNVKRVAWQNNKELVLSCILDARFKLSFLDADRHELYKQWLIAEAESQQQTDVKFYKKH
ncbi:hypothetical protein ACQ4LE_006912 [Meloidogyne hapla]